MRLSGARRRAGSRRGAPLLLSLAVRRARRLLLTGPVTGPLLLSRTIWLTGLQLSRPALSRRTVLPVLAGLKLPVRPVRIDEIGIGAAEFALLEYHLASEILCRVELPHKALVPQNHRLRNHQRHRGEAGAARAGPNGEAARALRQKPEPRAGAVIDLDLADPAIGIGIELDRDVVRIVGGGAFRHFDQTGGAANAQRCGRRRDLHVAALCHGGGDESRGTPGDVEDRRVALAAILIDVIVDGDPGVRLEIEGGGIDEGDAERRIRTRLHHVVEIDVVLDLERGGLWSLRITLALPVTVATLPTGSSGACASAAGVAGSDVAGSGAAWAWASCVGSEEAAETLFAPLAMVQANSRSARESGRCIKGFREGRGGRGARRGDFSLAGLNTG